MSGVLEAIFSAATHGFAQKPQTQAQLSPDDGLVGDRYAGSGVISLIQAEEVEAFNRATGLAIGAEETGRNLLTRGVALNPLLGRQFRIGEVLLEGIELCEPCATLGKHLSTQTVTDAQVVKALTGKAGLRARVCSGGSIQPGTEIGGAE